MIGTPNTNQETLTTHGTANVTNVTPENHWHLLDRVPETGTLNPGAPGRRDPGSLQELRSAVVSGADNGALLDPGADARSSELGPVTPELEMVKDESIEDTTEQTDARPLPYFDKEALDKAMNHKYALILYLIRMSALFPETEDLNQMAKNIYKLLDDSGVGAANVVCLLRGRLVDKKTQLSDLRAVLSGHAIYLRNKPKKRRVVAGMFSMEQCRIIGRLLPTNMPMTSIAKAAGCGRDMVMETERMFRIRKAYKDSLRQSAIDAVANGVSIRGFAKQHGMTKSRAERMLNVAKRLHKEMEAAQCILRQDQSQ